MADIVVCGDLEGEIEKSGDLSKLEALGSIEIFNELCSQAATQKLLDRLQIKSSYLLNTGLPNGGLNRERLPIDVACRSPAPAARAPANVDRTHTGAANINDLLTISRLVDNQLTC
jgi:hypothetical protein